MRLAPVAIFFHSSLDKVIQRCRDSSYTTHPGKTAADLCGFLGYLIGSGMQRGCEEKDVPTAAEFLDTCVESFLAHSDSQNRSDALVRLLQASEADGSTERCWNWRDP